MEKKKIKLNYELSSSEVVDLLNLIVSTNKNKEDLRHTNLEYENQTITFSAKAPDGLEIYATIGSDGYVDFFRRGESIYLEDYLYNQFQANLVKMRNVVVDFYNNNLLTWQTGEDYHIDENDEFDIISSGDDEFEKGLYDLKFND